MKKLTCFLFVTLLIAQSLKAQKVELINGHVHIQGQSNEEIVTLDLSNWNLTELPSNLSSFSNLKQLKLSSNALKDVGGLSQLQSLESLDLSNNPELIVSSLNGVLSNLNYLQSLDLSHCQLIYVPFDVYNLKNLHTLDLSHNDIHLISFEILKLKQLETLLLNHNRINFIDYGIINLNALSTLDLSNNRILNFSHLYVQLSHLTHLKRLTLDYPADVALSTGFKNIKTLEHLEIHGFKGYLEDGFLSKIDQLESLTMKGEDVEHAEFVQCLNQRNMSGLKNLSLEFEHWDNSALNQVHLDQLSKLTLKNSGDLTISQGISNLDQIDSLILIANSIEKLPGEMIQMNALKWVQITAKDQLPSNLTEIDEAMTDCVFEVNKTVLTSSKNGLRPPLEIRDVEFEKYIVRSDSSQVIQTSTGTRLNIPPNAFLLPNGEVAQGNIEISYREFNDPIDMVFAGVPMMEKEGDEIFSFYSAGMLEFNATQQGQELMANPDQLIQVNYNSPFEGEEYDLFKLDAESERWSNLGKDSISDSPTSESRAIPTELPLMEYPEPPEYLTPPYNQSKLYLDVNKETKWFVRQKKRRPNLYKVTTRSAKRRIKRDTLNKVYSELNALNRLKWKPVFEDRHGTDYEDYLSFKNDLDTFNDFENQIRNRFNFTNLEFQWSEIIYIQDFWIEPNKERDNFDFVFVKTGQEVRLAAEPIIRTKRADVAQRKIKQFYKRYERSLENRREDWARIDSKFGQEMKVYMDQMSTFETRYKQYQEVIEEYRKQSLNDIKGYAATEAAVVRSFELSSFGIFNCDIRRRMEDPTPLLASFESDSGEVLEPTRLYVMDQTNNGMLSFLEGDRMFYDAKSQNSLIAILPEDRIGVIAKSDFKDSDLNLAGSTAKMKIYDMKQTTIEELRKNVGFF